MDVWLMVKTEYDEYSLFSENFCVLWIYNWFNEKIDNLNSKLSKDIEINIDYSIINMFFHDCLEICLDPQKYITNNPFILGNILVHKNSRLIYDIQTMARKIVYGIAVNYNDILGQADYIFGCDMNND